MVSTLPGMVTLVTAVDAKAYEGIALSTVPMVRVLRLEQLLKV